jgi:hypothetical protein
MSQTHIGSDAENETKRKCSHGRLHGFEPPESQGKRRRDGAWRDIKLNIAWPGRVRDERLSQEREEVSELRKKDFLKLS